jgi:hypothetical protein
MTIVIFALKHMQKYLNEKSIIPMYSHKNHQDPFCKNGALASEYHHLYYSAFLQQYTCIFHLMTIGIFFLNVQRHVKE